MWLCTKIYIKSCFICYFVFFFFIFVACLFILKKCILFTFLHCFWIVSVQKNNTYLLYEWKRNFLFWTKLFSSSLNHRFYIIYIFFFNEIFFGFFLIFNLNGNYFPSEKVFTCVCVFLYKYLNLNKKPKICVKYIYKCCIR